MIILYITSTRYQYPVVVRRIQYWSSSSTLLHWYNTQKVHNTKLKQRTNHSNKMKSIPLKSQSMAIAALFLSWTLFLSSFPNVHSMSFIAMDMRNPEKCVMAYYPEDTKLDVLYEILGTYSSSSGSTVVHLYCIVLHSAAFFSCVCKKCIVDHPHIITALLLHYFYYIIILISYTFEFYIISFAFISNTTNTQKIKQTPKKTNYHLESKLQTVPFLKPKYPSESIPHLIPPCPIYPKTK
jgi:hypothetical protein